MLNSLFSVIQLRTHGHTSEHRTADVDDNNRRDIVNACRSGRRLTTLFNPMSQLLSSLAVKTVSS